jgi:hypothetical protein
MGKDLTQLQSKMAQKAVRKPDITGGQMAASAGINTFFTVNCLIDFSVAQFALTMDEVAFFQHFLKWREAEGIIGGIM